MPSNIGERLSSVETKVGALVLSQEAIAADVRTVRDYVLAEQAKKKLTKQVFACVGGLAAFCAAGVKIISYAWPK